jgi:hypothetical protein
MATRPVTLGGLIRLGAEDLAHHLERDHHPSSTLEWLGIAVTHLPELSAQARTADEVHGHSRTQSIQLRGSLLDRALKELGAAAALLDQARERHARRHPDVAGEGDPEDYAILLETAHSTSPRHAEMMIGSYTAFLGGAIEAAGAVAEADLAIARARRWERHDHERLVELRAAQLHVALSNALGGLLAYARVIADEAARLSD